MSRFFYTICALLIAAPLMAMASQSTDFERPDARYAINMVIGDASYVDKTGAEPPLGPYDNERVRIHLAFVHDLLSRRDSSALPPELREAREAHLARLQEYIDAGVFPQNHAYLGETRPCFIDDDERICAVGYLVEQSAGRAVAERINAKYQYSFIGEMQLPALDHWIARSGLSPIELAMIQPEYWPPGPYCDTDFGVEVMTSGMSVRILGAVSGYDYWGNCCAGANVVVVNFGDAVWSSEFEITYDYYWHQPVDVTHVYSTPGTKVITAGIVSAADDPSPCFSTAWTVNVTAPTLPVHASTWGAIKAMYR